MLKILIFSIVGIAGLALLLFVILILFTSWQARKHPPSYGLIEQKYYVCRKFRLLEGGIYGKQLLLKFAPDNAQTWCWRDEWEEIDKDTFKQLATDWYGKTWSDETPFWQEE